MFSTSTEPVFCTKCHARPGAPALQEFTGRAVRQRDITEAARPQPGQPPRRGDMETVRSTGSCRTRWGEGVGYQAEHAGVSTAASCLQHLEAALLSTAQVGLSLHEECLAHGAGEPEAEAERTSQQEDQVQQMLEAHRDSRTICFQAPSCLSPCRGHELPQVLWGTWETASGSDCPCCPDVSPESPILTFPIAQALLLDCWCVCLFSLLFLTLASPTAPTALPTVAQRGGRIPPGHISQDQCAP